MSLPQTALKDAQVLFEKQDVSYTYIENCAKVAIVGAGITGVPGIVSKIVTTLANNGVAIYQSADSYTTIWILVAESDLRVAVNSLHTAFLQNENQTKNN